MMIFLFPVLFSAGMSNDTHQKIGEYAHTMGVQVKETLKKNLIGEAVIENGKMIGYNRSLLGNVGLLANYCNSSNKITPLAASVACYGVYKGDYGMAKKAALSWGISKAVSYPMKWWVLNIDDFTSHSFLETNKSGHSFYIEADEVLTEEKTVKMKYEMIEVTAKLLGKYPLEKIYSKEQRQEFKKNLGLESSVEEKNLKDFFSEMTSEGLLARLKKENEKAEARKKDVFEEYKKQFSNENIGAFFEKSNEYGESFRRQKGYNEMKKNKKGFFFEGPYELPSTSSKALDETELNQLSNKIFDKIKNISEEFPTLKVMLDSTMQALNDCQNNHEGARKAFKDLSLIIHPDKITQNQLPLVGKEKEALEDLFKVITNFMTECRSS